jgi:hypothetical protein
MEDIEIWIKFANLCRKGGRLNLSYKTLSQMLVEPSKDFMDLNFVKNTPSVIYACLKHLWARGHQEHAFLQMKKFTQVIVNNLGIQSLSDINAHADRFQSEPENLSMMSLLARCYLKTGEWQIARGNWLGILYRKLYNHTLPQLIVTRIGIKRGMHGHSPILKFFLIMKDQTKIFRIIHLLTMLYLLFRALSGPFIYVKIMPYRTRFVF